MITILGRHLTARQIAAVAHVIVDQGLNIDGIQRLTGRPSLSEAEDTHAKGCIEFSVRGTPKDYARYLIAERYDVPPLPSIDLFRYGFHAHQN